MALKTEAARLIDLAREEGKAEAVAAAQTVTPRRIAVVILRAYADAIAGTAAQMTDLPQEARDALSGAVSGMRECASALDAPPEPVPAPSESVA